MPDAHEPALRVYWLHFLVNPKNSLSGVGAAIALSSVRKLSTTSDRLWTKWLSQSKGSGIIWRGARDENQERAFFPWTVSEQKDEKHRMVCLNLPFLLIYKQPTIIVLAFKIHIAETAALSAGNMPAKQECVPHFLLHTGIIRNMAHCRECREYESFTFVQSCFLPAKCMYVPLATFGFP